MLGINLKIINVSKKSLDELITSVRAISIEFDILAIVSFISFSQFSSIFIRNKVYQEVHVDTFGSRILHPECTLVCRVCCIPDVGDIAFVVGILAVTVVTAGIKYGIEKASKVLMPVMFIILVGVVIYCLALAFRYGSVLQKESDETL